jgi:hypothetical protein
MLEIIAEFNERFAVWSVSRVSTMACAYVFAVIALIAFPQAVHDSFATGFAPMPLVTWLSQSFLQLTLLSVIMVGQTIQGRASEKRSEEQYNAVMEMLGDMRAEHDERREILEDVRTITEKLIPR